MRKKYIFAGMTAVIFIVFMFYLIGMGGADMIERIVGYNMNPPAVTRLSAQSGDSKSDPVDSYTSFTETHCIGKQCVETIYSVSEFPFSNSTRIESASSLMGSAIGVSIKQDKDFPITVLDYNLTSITVRLNVTSAQLNKDIPIQVFDSYNASNIYSNTTLRLSIPSLPVRTLNFSLGETLKFGFNSSTITLNESNGGNLGDTNTLSSSSNYNYGAATNINIGYANPNKYYGWFMWNMSVIPVGSTITNANMSIYLNLENTLEVMSAYNSSVNNATGIGPWAEGTATGSACSGGNRCDIRYNLTWENQPAVGTLQGSFYSAQSTGWLYWNVTNAAITAFSVGKNMSIVVLNSTVGNTQNRYTSKEGTSTQRPQLVITYTTGGGGVTPMPGCSAYPGSGDWILNCSDRCQINTTTNIGANTLYLNNSGTILINATVVAKRIIFLNQSMCPVALASGTQVVLG